MSKFSDYPGDPPDDYRDPFPEEDEVIEIMEPDGCRRETPLTDAEVERIKVILSGLCERAYAECSACEARGIEEMIRYQEAAEKALREINTIEPAVAGGEG